MKIAVLHSGSPIDVSLAAMAQRNGHEILAVKQVEPKWKPIARIWSRRKPSFFEKLGQTAFAIYYVIFLKRKVDQALNKEFSPRSVLGQVKCISDINNDSVLHIIREFSPELIVTAGVGILSNKWQQLGTPIANVHLGITPTYRGRMCWFWPIVEDRIDEIGCTIHEVIDKVDAGRVLVQRRISVPDLHTFDIRGILVGVGKLSHSCTSEFLETFNCDGFTSRTSLSLSPSTRPAYLEPTILDYLKYRRSLKRILLARAEG